MADSTCHNVSESADKFKCSNCGATWRLEDCEPIWRDGVAYYPHEPTLWLDGVAHYPHFCQLCGMEIREGDKMTDSKTAIERVEELLIEHGADYRVEQRQARLTFEPFTRFTVLDESGGLRGVVDAFLNGNCAYIWQDEKLTPEQAIAATLGGGARGTRWHKLFGTPEKAAKTINIACNEGYDGCGGCPAKLAQCGGGKYDVLIEWLREKAVKR